MTTAKYSKEFKEDALRIAEREGVKAASERLGIIPRQIYDWRKQKRENGVMIPRGLNTGETMEEYARRLERECAELSEANMILKKAIGFLVGR